MNALINDVGLSLTHVTRDFFVPIPLRRLTEHGGTC
jgi:hypothetical protein